ncbi:MAG: hypothetical protein FJZ96_05515 [Chloroflexi bacterium]|nr:hypothetical protein [Chloroflexota bacterium]
MPDEIIINNLTRPQPDVIRIKRCASFLCQLRGFTFRWNISPREGLLLEQNRDGRIGSSIHMLAVFSDLAVFWINSRKTVVHKALARKWRPAYIPPVGAMYVLEMHPGHINDFDIGHEVEFIDA